MPYTVKRKIKERKREKGVTSSRSTSYTTLFHSSAISFPALFLHKHYTKRLIPGSILSSNIFFFFFRSYFFLTFLFSALFLLLFFRLTLVFFLFSLCFFFFFLSFFALSTSSNIQSYLDTTQPPR